ncbi:hypothetical protein [endosymbiont GvMRE of Glomus versiforme]|uniref:hypothetical protein n=1 Tax=endosymbiont GvMRE of Glomus versiforme TaxID=2039283 RepID=UPI000EE35CF9|nr:hypothetical protein [endosymbiont GvMRE of Glomus versiforme]RHZ37347.1 hypothetical protein GvMRE_I1g281 [endosymbiont GvMRE of Glomus versiforme]
MKSHASVVNHITGSTQNQTSTNICPHCNQTYTWSHLKYHELYDCPNFQGQPNPQLIHKQQQVLNNLQSVINKVAQNLQQNIVQKINSNPQLTPQQKQVAINNLNEPINSLQTSLATTQSLQQKLNALVSSSQIGNDSKKSKLPLIIGVGLIGGGLVVGLVFWLVARNKKVGKTT